MAPLPTLEPSLGAAARAPDNPKGLSGRRKEADDEGEDVAEPDKSKVYIAPLAVGADHVPQPQPPTAAAATAAAAAASGVGI